MVMHQLRSALVQYDPQADRVYDEKQQERYYRNHLNIIAEAQQAAEQQEASKAKAILDKRRKAILDKRRKAILLIIGA